MEQGQLQISLILLGRMADYQHAGGLPFLDQVLRSGIKISDQNIGDYFQGLAVAAAAVGSNDQIIFGYVYFIYCLAKLAVGKND
jgi:hypothetical protein